LSVDFGPYVKRIIHKVSDNWHELVPATSESKKGKLAIEFAIKNDGKVTAMCLVATSGDAALDRAAWKGIIASNPFPPLPTDFNGPYLAMRFRFHYNPNQNDPQQLSCSGLSTVGSRLRDFGDGMYSARKCRRSVFTNKKRNADTY
jgi:TonB family protein